MALPQVDKLADTRDVPSLIRLLSSADTHIQHAAQDALIRLGTEASDPLMAALSSKDPRIRMGVIGALAGLHEVRAVPFLVQALADASNEVRWQVVIALGEIKDPSVTGPLVSSLTDPDKYVRYGAALSLTDNGWNPGNATETVWFLAAMQDWENLGKTGKPAVPVLFVLIHDRDREVRVHAVRTLGNLQDRKATEPILEALRDPDREVRWEAALAARKCGISSFQLPRALFNRPRTTKSPLIAGFLNFILPGLGYGYLGKWWGIMIFQVDVTISLWLFKAQGEANAYAILYPVYILLGVHAWYITKMMPEDPP